MGFPPSSAGKESACHSGDLGLIPGLGRSPEEGKGYPPQYSGLEDSMDCIAHGGARSQTWLSDFHFTFLSPHGLFSLCFQLMSSFFYLFTFFFNVFLLLKKLLITPGLLKSWLSGKDPDAGKDWSQKEKGAAEDEKVRWQWPTQWTWIWANSRGEWRTEKPGVLQPVGTRRAGHNPVTK